MQLLDSSNINSNDSENVLTECGKSLAEDSYRQEEHQKPIASSRQAPVFLKMGLGIEQCRKIIHFISPADHTWTSVGSALKHELGYQGYDLWLEWSCSSGEWSNDYDFQQVWDELSPQDITMSSIIHWAHLNGWQPDTPILDVSDLRQQLPRIPRGILGVEVETHLGLLAESQGNLPYEAAFCCFLGALSFAIGGNKTLYVQEGWKAKGQLWLALVGASGSGKSHILNACGMGFLKQQEIEEAEAAKTEFEEACINLPEGEAPRAPNNTRRLTADSITTEALFHHAAKEVNEAGFGVYADEILAVVNGMDQYKGKGGDQQAWLTIHNHGPAEMTRIGENRKIKSCFVPLLGGIQPAELKKLIGYEKQGNGFAARFLMCHAERGEVLEVERRLELGRMISDNKGRAHIEAMFQKLLNIRDQKAVIKMTLEAEMHFLRYMKYLDDLAITAEPAEESAYRKLQTYIYRVALLIHYWSELQVDRDPDSQELGLRVAEQTTCIMEFFRESMLHSYGIIQSSIGDQALQSVINKVRTHGRQATREKIKQSLRSSIPRILKIETKEGFKKAGELIDELLKKGVLAEDQDLKILKIGTEVQK